MEKHDIFPDIPKIPEKGVQKKRFRTESDETEDLMKKKQFLMISAAAVLMISLAAGCVTDYRAAAAGEAREYLLKNMEGLSVMQRNYIRYNDPVILNMMLWENVIAPMMPDAHIVTRHEQNTYSDPRRDMMMQCFGWRVPGMEKDVFVVGTAQRDFRFWDPDRIVLRRRISDDIAGYKIQKKAVHFVMMAQPELKGELRNIVRFEPPQVHNSLFLLEKPEKTENSGNWMEFLKRSTGKEPMQISAVWIDPVSKKRIVAVGTANSANLNDWVPVKFSEITEEDAKTFLGTKYTVLPDETEDPFYQKGR